MTCLACKRVLKKLEVMTTTYREYAGASLQVHHANVCPHCLSGRIDYGKRERAEKPKPEGGGK